MLKATLLTILLADVKTFINTNNSKVVGGSASSDSGSSRIENLSKAKIIK